MKFKNVIIAALSLSMVASFSTTNISHAAEIPTQTLSNLDGPIITPYWSHISIISPSLTSSGNTLYPEVFILAQSTSGKISGTMYVDREVGSDLWASVASWGFSGTGDVFVAQSYVGTTGYKYRLRVVVTINGETAIATSFPRTL